MGQGAPSRPQPVGGAYDAKPKWARDQSNGGTLSRVYTDATNNYLRDAGLSEEDCNVIAGA
jgi:hypothetical protein